MTDDRPFRVTLQFELVVEAGSAGAAITAAKRLVRRPGQPTAYLTAAKADALDAKP